MTFPAHAQPLPRALALAALIALGASLSPLPAYAGSDPATTESTAPASTPTASTAPEGNQAPLSSPASPTAGVPADGLAEAVLRDLGMSLEQFNAAGEQGKRAAAALVTLRKAAGFEAVRLEGGKIVVAGTGPAVARAVAALNAADPQARKEFVLAPASAAAAPKATVLHAASVEQLYRAYVREVGPAGLQAVAEADGKFIIRTGGVNEPQSEPQPAAEADAGASAAGQPPASASLSGGGRLSPSEFVGKYANVVLESGEPLAPEEDFFGGQGYRIDGDVVCSAGFSAFSPEGQPLVLTAGHCADDGVARLAEVTLPAGDPAGGFLAENAVTGKLGTFGFSQFGGPGNSWVADPSNPGSPGNDIAVIESIRPDLNLLPATTTWADGTSLGTGSVKIVGMAAPFVGQAVCRSGRTAGWSCGTVDEVGIYIVGGGSGDPADLRSFSGFLSTSVQSSGGDSGGPWISGNYAVGTHSAGNASGSPDNFAVAATLQDSMSILPGVSLRLFLNRPVLAGPLPAGPVSAGQRIVGRLAAAPATDIPAGTRVRVTFPGSEPLDAAVDARGNWFVSAPGAADSFTAVTVNGFSRSEQSSFNTEPKPAVSAPPAAGGPGGAGASGGPGDSSAPGAGSPAAPPPAAGQVSKPAVLAPAPQPTVVAAIPAAGPVPAASPDSGPSPVALADTGVSGLTLAAAGAGAVLLLGGALLLVVRRRGRR